MCWCYFFSGIRKIVYSCSDKKLCEISGQGLGTKIEDIYQNTDSVIVIKNILEAEGIAIHKSFYKKE